MRVLQPTRNRTKVLVNGTITAGATSIALNAGEGAKLPDPSTEGNFRLVLFDSSLYNDPSDDPLAEDVVVTGKATDTLTVLPVSNNHTSVVSQYLMYLSWDKVDIDTTDDILQDMTREVSSITYNMDGQPEVITTSTRTYTLSYSTTGLLATIVTDDSPATTYTLVYDADDVLQSITRT